jgi:glycosyltransferase involved in cell wall biosynthesis
MNKILSIITVNKDSADNLFLTINSLLPILSWRSVEFIIVDGASSDNSLLVINDFKNYVSKYISEPDLGIYDAMNKGISLSSGEWLWFLNSGDQSRLNLFDLRNIFLCLDKNINFLYSDFYINNNIIVNQKLSLIGLMRGMINHQSIFYKRNLFGKFEVNFKLAADFAHLLTNYKLIKSKKIPYPISEFNLFGASSKFTKKVRFEIWYFRLLAFRRANINIIYKAAGIIFCISVCFLKIINPYVGSNIIKLRKDLEL